MKKIQIVFTKPTCEFVEIEQDGRSIKIGKWQERADGFWVLEIDDPRVLPETLRRRIVKDTRIEATKVVCPHCQHSTPERQLRPQEHRVFSFWHHDLPEFGRPVPCRASDLWFLIDMVEEEEELS